MPPEAPSVAPSPSVTLIIQNPGPSARPFQDHCESERAYLVRSDVIWVDSQGHRQAPAMGDGCRRCPPRAPPLHADHPAASFRAAEHILAKARRGTGRSLRALRVPRRCVPPPSAAGCGPAPCRASGRGRGLRAATARLPGSGRSCSEEGDGLGQPAHRVAGLCSQALDLTPQRVGEGKRGSASGDEPQCKTELVGPVQGGQAVVRASRMRNRVASSGTFSPAS